MSLNHGFRKRLKYRPELVGELLLGRFVERFRFRSTARLNRTREFVFVLIHVMCYLESSQSTSNGLSVFSLSCELA